jgi:uncharacterized protein YkwD
MSELFKKKLYSVYRQVIDIPTQLGLFLCVTVFVTLIFLVVNFYYLKEGFVSDGYLASIYAATLVELANQDRFNTNLAALTVNPLLVLAARQKAEDMINNGYFAHVSPEGVTPWFWMQKVGYSFDYAGENLAINFSESIDVENAWTNSPGHHANIVNGKFTEIGIATVQGKYKGKETVFVVQMFGKPKLKPLKL